MKYIWIIDRYFEARDQRLKASVTDPVKPYAVI